MVWERSEREHVTCLLLAGVELFPESNAELLAERVEGLEVLLVLLLVLDLGLDALEDANSGGEVVDAAGSLQGSSEDLNGRDKVVGEAVVEVTLELENILDTVEFLLESGRELLICLVIVLTGAANRGGAEAGAVDSQSHGGLHPG